MIFGDWYRPISELPNQIALGMNFVIGYESGGAGGPYTRAQYKSACQALGLKYVLQAPPDDATLALEASDAFCLGWDLVDEPNAGPPSTTSVSVLQSTAAKYRAAAPSKIVMLNLDGNQEESWNPTWSYPQAVACCDWLFFDFYVRNRLGPSVDLKATFQPKIDRFKGYCTKAQKFGFFVETDDQLLSEQGWSPLGCGPSNADVQAYFDLAKSNQCDLLAFFEDVIGKSWVSYDSTTPAMYTLIKQNIAALSPITPKSVVSVNSVHGSTTLTYSDGSTQIL